MVIPGKVRRRLSCPIDDSLAVLSFIHRTHLYPLWGTWIRDIVLRIDRGGSQNEFKYCEMRSWMHAKSGPLIQRHCARLAASNEPLLRKKILKVKPSLETNPTSW
jgi:hypothetical protein